MSKHKQWYVRLDDGRVVGPMGSGQVKKLTATGRIGPETLIRPDGQHWSPASRVKGLTFPKSHEVQSVAVGSQSQGTSTKPASIHPIISDGPAKAPPLPQSSAGDLDPALDAWLAKRRDESNGDGKESIPTAVKKKPLTGDGGELASLLLILQQADLVTQIRVHACVILFWGLSEGIGSVLRFVFIGMTENAGTAYPIFGIGRIVIALVMVFISLFNLTGIRLTGFLLGSKVFFGMAVMYALPTFAVFAIILTSSSDFTTAETATILLLSLLFASLFPGVLIAIQLYLGYRLHLCEKLFSRNTERLNYIASDSKRTLANWVSLIQIIRSPSHRLPVGTIGYAGQKLQTCHFLPADRVLISVVDSRIVSVIFRPGLPRVWIGGRSPNVLSLKQIRFGRWAGDFNTIGDAMKIVVEEDFGTMLNDWITNRTEITTNITDKYKQLQCNYLKSAHSFST